jgi:hypothetical protein
MLSEEQYQLLVEIAQQRGKPLSVLIREAIEAAYFKEAKQRRTALQRLLALVADWPEMEAEITSPGWLNSFLTSTLGG